MSIAKLIPLLDVDYNDIRPTLRVFPNQSIVMGRNTTTMIEQAEVSRELLRIEWQKGALHAIPLKEIHDIQINNELLKEPRIVNHGEVLSLLGNQFSYQVRYTTISTMASELTSNAKRKITDHVACPICMEILVQATILIPCGHRFCKDCCPDVECANCRTKIQAYIPDRGMDALLSELVKEKCLETDDSNMYMQRTEIESRQVASLTNAKDDRSMKRQRLNPESSSINSARSKHEVIVLS
mmetsp:Transcript_41005/g.46581  ORF Transcript_41005/g.46581 Transcript_41005/m.46581 type:complete len:241 (-) Transcript_41005:375-1097(-)